MCGINDYGRRGPSGGRLSTLAQRFGKWVPGFVLRRLMTVETAIEEAVAELSRSTPDGSRVLDAGSGEGRHREAFAGRRYVGVDLAVGDADWDYSGLDVTGDLSRLPFRDGSFDAALNVVVLEHTRDPQAVINEIARVLRPGGRLLLVAPQQWEVHQQPNDFFRFTRYGVELLLERAGLQVETLEPTGGHFTLLARRLVGSLNFFQGGARWLLFPFVAALAAAPALILPSLDSLDSEKDTTLAYRCFARKS